MASALVYILAGATLSFMPCSAFLLPIISYLFLALPKNKARYLRILEFIVGFSIGFAAIGLLVKFIGSNPLAIGFKLAISLVFIALGILSAIKPTFIGINFQVKTKSIFAYGFLLPLVLSLSPCGLPILAGVLVQFNILYFVYLWFGALLPYLAIILFAEIMQKVTHKIVKFTYWLEKSAFLLFIISGIYGLYSLEIFSNFDLSVGLGLFAALSLVILFYKLHKNSKQAVFIVTLYTFFILVWFFIFNFCNQHIEKNITYNFSCGHPIVCPYCLKCYIVFLLGVVISVLLFVISSRKIRVRVVR